MPENCRLAEGCWATVSAFESRLLQDCYSRNDRGPVGGRPWGYCPRPGASL